jgi:hypothetical protein
MERVLNQEIPFVSEHPFRKFPGVVQPQVQRQVNMWGSEMAETHLVRRPAVPEVLFALRTPASTLDTSHKLNIYHVLL